MEHQGRIIVDDVRHVIIPPALVDVAGPLFHFITTRSTHRNGRLEKIVCTDLDRNYQGIRAEAVFENGRLAVDINRGEGGMVFLSPACAAQSGTSSFAPASS